MGSQTPKLSLYKPAVGEDGWGDEVNNSFDTLDDTVLQSVQTVTSGIQLNTGDVALVDASGGAVTVTLPSPATKVHVNVKKIDSSSNTVTVATPGSETIDGKTELTISNQYTSRTIVSDGSNYYII